MVKIACQHRHQTAITVVHSSVVSKDENISSRNGAANLACQEQPQQHIVFTARRNIDASGRRIT